LPTALSHGLTAQGVLPASAARLAGLPPASVLFAALLGYNPVKILLGPALAHLPAARAAYLTGRRFFPSVIGPAFGHGLAAAFGFAIATCLIAAAVSLLRGRTYVHGDPRCPRQAHDGESRQQPPARSSPPLTHARLQQAGAPPLQAWVTPRIPRLHAQHRPVDYTRTVPRQPSLTCCHAALTGGRVCRCAPNHPGLTESSAIRSRVRPSSAVGGDSAFVIKSMIAMAVDPKMENVDAPGSPSVPALHQAP